MHATRARRRTEGADVSTPPLDLDDRANRIDDSWDAFVFYVDAAFSAAVAARGYVEGRAVVEETEVGETIRFSAQLPGGKTRAVLTGRDVANGIVTLVATNPRYRPRIIPVSDISGGRRHEQRWPDQKRAAPHTAELALRSFPPLKITSFELEEPTCFCVLRYWIDLEGPEQVCTSFGLQGGAYSWICAKCRHEYPCHPAGPDRKHP
jgi:hypothetical protein